VRSLIKNEKNKKNKKTKKQKEIQKIEIKKKIKSELKE